MKAELSVKFIYIGIFFLKFINKYLLGRRRHIIGRPCLVVELVAYNLRVVADMRYELAYDPLTVPSVVWI